MKSLFSSHQAPILSPISRVTPCATGKDRSLATSAAFSMESTLAATILAPSALNLSRRAS